MRRPKYLLLEDAVQDLIEAKGQEGLTILQICQALNSTYAAAHRALHALRMKKRITFEVRTRVHYYFPS